MARSRSASGRMIAGDLPPSSSETFFRLPAAACTISLPTSVDPVNATLSTSGCAANAAPAVSPNPVKMLTTPGGKPASWIRLPRRSAVIGVCSAAFSTTVQPAASAGAISPPPSAAEVPRNDLADDADRFLHGVGQVFARKGQRDRRSSDLGRPAAHIAKHIDRQRQVRDARDSVGLAVVDRFQLGQFFEVAFDQIGELPQHAPALGRADLGPAPLAEG